MMRINIFTTPSVLASRPLSTAWLLASLALSLPGHLAVSALQAARNTFCKSITAIWLHATLVSSVPHFLAASIISAASDAFITHQAELAALVDIRLASLVDRHTRPKLQDQLEAYRLAQETFIRSSIAEQLKQHDQLLRSDFDGRLQKATKDVAAVARKELLDRTETVKRNLDVQLDDLSDRLTTVSTKYADVARLMTTTVQEGLQQLKDDTKDRLHSLSEVQVQSELRIQ